MLKSGDMENNTDATPFICLRCGNCCSKYQALVEDAEMERIGCFLGITREEFISRYTDSRWPVPGKHLLCHSEKHCIFLVPRGEDWLCSVHPVKPQACRDWMAGPDRPECRKGMEERHSSACQMKGFEDSHQ